MATLVVPIWRDPVNGQDSGPMDYPAAATHTAVNDLITRAMRAARSAGGSNLRIILMDDMTGARIALIRPKQRKEPSPCVPG
ncbi:hypothetical protein UFOVP469_33 [uncultured Caudovirales phage]|uniref:Uncharacterized protein n=1 Tax=uncultured Caudovirales phage TaxID=2100421 RepID=A0A6J5R4S5_9CAUD|nr:hypothetical protein UFOVP469_33 [uncultured Caudovirales phage]CAB4189607.1 hypothetical protein UFOVP1200_6 [uncultured Caudovirales phage]